MMDPKPDKGAAVRSFDTIVILDADGIQRYVSASAERVHGYAPAELVDIPVIERMIHPDDQARVREAFRLIIETGEGGAEYRHRRKAGGWVHLEARGTNQLDNPDIRGVVVNVRDVTERVRITEELQAAEKRYRSLFDSMVNGFALHEIILDQAGNPCDYRYLEANPAFEQLTGLNARDIIGRRIMEIAPQTERHWIDTFGRVAMTGETIHFENYWGVRKKYYEVVAYRPAPGQFACVFTDITERRIAEERLRESESLLRSISSGLPAAMLYQIVRAPDGRRRFAFVSEGVRRLYGCSPEEAIADPGRIYGCVYEADRDRVLAEEETAFSEGVPFRAEVRIRNPGGDLRWSYFASSPHRLPDGSTSWDGIEIDITERKRLEDRLRQSEKMDAIGRLAGGIAHDFNNQLAGILGYAELLELKLEDPELRRFAESIRTTACRAADLTQQMLAFARKGKNLAVPVDLHAIVRDTAAILERSIDKRIEIRLRLDAAPSIVNGDPAQLQSVVLNLGLNARDAMPQGGELVFATAVETVAQSFPAEELSAGRYLVLSVTDSGIGMDAEQRKHIFEPFFTTKAPGKGTGLGLASVYGTVKNHGGLIRVYSEPGHGSTFRIHLPLSAESMPAEPAPTSMPALERGRGRILLVDDEAVVLDVGRELLGRLGYEVIACADPVEALALYRREWRGIDLVILDMIMPKMGGKDLFLALQRIHPQVRALLSSGYAVSGEAQGILDAGVLAFMQKPFRQETLARMVAEAMQKGSG